MYISGNFPFYLLEKLFFLVVRFGRILSESPQSYDFLKKKYSSTESLKWVGKYFPLGMPYFVIQYKPPAWFPLIIIMIPFLKRKSWDYCAIQRATVSLQENPGYMKNGMVWILQTVCCKWVTTNLDMKERWGSCSRSFVGPWPRAVMRQQAKF